jgi:hypothetical protein
MGPSPGESSARISSAITALAATPTAARMTIDLVWLRIERP